MSISACSGDESKAGHPSLDTYSTYTYMTDEHIPCLALSGRANGHWRNTWRCDDVCSVSSERAWITNENVSYGLGSIKVEVIIIPPPQSEMRASRLDRCAAIPLQILPGYYIYAQWSNGKGQECLVLLCNHVPFIDCRRLSQWPGSCSILTLKRIHFQNMI